MKTDLDNTFEPPAPVCEVKPTREDILGALKWSAPREIATKNGPRLVTDAPSNDLVAQLWRDEHDALFAAGYSFGEWPRFSGKFKISKWEKIPEKVLVSRLTTQALSRATDADINAPAPEGLAYLGYQKAGVAFAFEKSATLFGDEPGLGKTIQAIGVLNCSPDLKRILVICPASLKLNWRRELEKWLVRKRPILIADAKMFCVLADGIVVVNYDVLFKHIEILRATVWDCVIADEAHFCKTRDSRRTKCLFGYKPKKKEKDKGVPEEPALVAKKRMLLTGTPIANRPIELFPLINYLDPFRWNSYWKYAQRYCGANEFNGWDTTGSSHLDELQEILRQSVMVRRLKKDVLKELPDKIRKIVEFPATKEMAHVINQELEAYEGVDELEAEVELAAASDDPNAYEEAAAKLAAGRKAVFEGLSTLRRETAEAKIPLVIAHLEEAVEESEKVVCMAHHKSVVAAIMAKFGNAAVALVGDTGMQERQAAVDRFQTDPTCKLFVGSIMAAGVGITLTAASHVIFAELDWVPGNVSQAEDRCHRIGQHDSVLVEHLVLEGSLDATMARRIISKQEVIDKALDVVAEKKPAAEAGSPPPRPKSDPSDLLAIEADKMTADQRDAATEAIRFLAARCNGARDWDGMGFSKIDTRIGKELGARKFLSKKQCALARKVATKYRGQLPEALVERMRG